MSNEFVLNAEPRTQTGRGPNHRLRVQDKVPAIMYGIGHEPMTLSISHNELVHKLENEAFFSKILTVKVNGKDHKAVLRDLQRHPAKPRIVHADFQSVSETQRITMHVPLHFINDAIAPGVKEGGIVSHLLTNVEVRCMAKDLPEFVEVDLANLALNHSLHLSDLNMPSGVQVVALASGADHDLPVVSIHVPSAAVEEAPVAAAAEAAAGEAAAPAAAGAEKAPAAAAKPAAGGGEKKK